MLPSSARICDVGSGAGLPGVVLALARDDVQVVLLEPLLRRARFLAEVVEALDLHNAVVRRARAEELAGQESFDVVTARAVAALPVLVGWALPLVRGGGQLIAWKGDTAAAEVAAAQPALRRAGAGAVRIETYGTGVVEPPATVVRIVSGRTVMPSEEGSR